MSYKITTPLYYVNDKPHLGSSYTTIACDALARYKRLCGEDVLFITGVDEHGQKIQQTAERSDINPQKHCDNITNKYIELWSKLNISYDKFIRTTSDDHKEFVYSFYDRVKAAGDIRIGRQQGWYCVGCEEYKDKNISNTQQVCELHNKPLEWRDEENLFFCLSKYQKQIEELVTSDQFIKPGKRKNEIINFVESGLKDFSISRANVSWGIDVPDKQGQTFYVWFDALLGYISASLRTIESHGPENIDEKSWPISLHVIGKDILRFHAVYWPAMLISAGYKIPLQVFGHGFLTREGKKMGKSIGNVLDPIILLEYSGIDAMRWYLLRDIEFGDDGDFQLKRFIDIINSDLSNTIGNLLNRTLNMSRKWFNDSTPNKTNEVNNSSLKLIAEKCSQKFIDNLEKCNFKSSSEAIIELANAANLYINDKEPWKLIKDSRNTDLVASIIYEVLEATRIIGVLINPLIPNYSERILTQLNVDMNSINFNSSLKWGLLAENTYLHKPKLIMEKLEKSDEL